MTETSLGDRLKVVETKYQKNNSGNRFLNIAEKFKVILLKGGRRILSILVEHSGARINDNIFIAKNTRGEPYISVKPRDDQASRD